LWAIVTATTVGYGDISPVTTEGRVIAVGLMLLGIGVIGAFTATVASFFVTQEEDTGRDDVEARLARLEAKIDQLLAAQERPDDGRPSP
jgi:voltage-gated potassium channel